MSDPNPASALLRRVTPLASAPVRFDSLDPERGPRSLVFEDPKAVIAAHSPEEVLPALQYVETEVAKGAYAAGFLAYEAAPAFDPAIATRRSDGGMPLLWFGIHDHPIEIEPLAGLATEDRGYELGKFSPSLGLAEYERLVQHILDLIGAGDTYQVNLTFRLCGAFQGSSLDLYRDVARAQRSAFCAYLPIGEQTVVSASPELFFRYEGSQIEMRPMKGTRPRGRWREEDEMLATELASSAKDRAENLMIVDLLRNDLGRVVEFGSVRVPRLFEVESYPTVHQLTSTLKGALREGTRVSDLFRALFPSGSITGAPKIRTSQIIRDLEGSPRGPYTGAIGFLGPEEGVFSVAIRTIVIDEEPGRFELGVGSGITADSSPAAEYAECLGKGAFLYHRPPDFQLLESLRLEAPGGYILLDRHVARLLSSAAYFGFQVDEAAIRETLSAEVERIRAGVYKVRLLVSKTGEIRVGSEPIEDETVPVELSLATEAVKDSDTFLFHKTTNREVYRRAIEEAEAAGDVILYNQKGELTETTRSNLVLEIDGRMLTPPIESGLLPGTLRQSLLEEGKIQEKVLTTDDLRRASRLYLINSVRGWREAELKVGGTHGS